ncbi:MAG: hypothetical protein SFX72_18125 [Isosphaeraceae bacterium]|nr:hypothetical protein [Isosphaeraceae bacterium]
MSRENPSGSWTYRMEVSPTGQSPTASVPAGTDPVALLNALVSLQSQSIDLQKQILETQKQQLEFLRETTLVARDQRQRQFQELERWQQSHDGVLEHCKEALGQLEQVHSSLMRDMAAYIADNHENLVEGDFALSDFVDRFGPRLAHLNTMLAVLRPLTINLKKPESGGS